MRKCTTCSLNCKSVCRLHEALQEVHRMLVRAPVPVNPFPAVSNIFLRYGCRLDLWDSRLVNIIIILSFYGCTSALCCNLYCSLSVTAFCRLQSGTREGCSAEVVFLMYSMVQVMQPPCKLCKVSTSWNHHQHQSVHQLEPSAPKCPPAGTIIQHQSVYQLEPSSAPKACSCDGTQSEQQSWCKAVHR